MTKKYRNDIPLKIYCPICGEEMDTDIHAPEDGAKWRTPPGPPPYKHPDELRNMDNWICLRNHKHHCVVFDREDIENWLE